MAFATTKQSGKDMTYVSEFVADSASDIQNLPVQPEVATGSSCLVIATGDVYVLNSTGNWIAI